MSDRDDRESYDDDAHVDVTESMVRCVNCKDSVPPSLSYRDKKGKFYCESCWETLKDSDEE